MTDSLSRIKCELVLSKVQLLTFIHSTSIFKFLHIDDQEQILETLNQINQLLEELDND